MEKPRFQIGDKVQHRQSRRVFYVTKCINANDPQDIKAQGVRYELQALHPAYWFGRPEQWSAVQQDLQKVERAKN